MRTEYGRRTREREMAGGPFPDGWTDQIVSIDLVGGPSGLVGIVTDSNEGGCVVEMEAEPDPETFTRPRPRQIFYPWTAIQAIELTHIPRPGARPAESPEEPAP